MHYGWLDFSWRMESEMLMTGLSLITLYQSVSIIFYHAFSRSIFIILSLQRSFCLCLLINNCLNGVTTI